MGMPIMPGSAGCSCEPWLGEVSGSKLAGQPIMHFLSYYAVPCTVHLVAGRLADKTQLT